MNLLIRLLIHLLCCGLSLLLVVYSLNALMIQAQVECTAYATNGCVIALQPYPFCSSYTS